MNDLIGRVILSFSIITIIKQDVMQVLVFSYSLKVTWLDQPDNVYNKSTTRINSHSPVSWPSPENAPFRKTFMLLYCKFNVFKRQSVVNIDGSKSFIELFARSLETIKNFYLYSYNLCNGFFIF